MEKIIFNNSNNFQASAIVFDRCFETVLKKKRDSERGKMTNMEYNVIWPLILIKRVVHTNMIKEQNSIRISRRFISKINEVKLLKSQGRNRRTSGFKMIGNKHELITAC